MVTTRSTRTRLMESPKRGQPLREPRTRSSRVASASPEHDPPKEIARRAQPPRDYYEEITKRRQSNPSGFPGQPPEDKKKSSRRDDRDSQVTKSSKRDREDTPDKRRDSPSSETDPSQSSSGRVPSRQRSRPKPSENQKSGSGFQDLELIDGKVTRGDHLISHKGSRLVFSSRKHEDSEGTEMPNCAAAAKILSEHSDYKRDVKVLAVGHYNANPERIQILSDGKEMARINRMQAANPIIELIEVISESDGERKQLLLHRSNVDRFFKVKKDGKYDKARGESGTRESTYEKAQMRFLHSNNALKANPELRQLAIEDFGNFDSLRTKRKARVLTKAGRTGHSEDDSHDSTDASDGEDRVDDETDDSDHGKQDSDTDASIISDSSVGYSRSKRSFSFK